MKRKAQSNSSEPSSKRPRLQSSLDGSQNTARASPKIAGSRTGAELLGGSSERATEVVKADPRNTAASEQFQFSKRKEKIRKLAPPRPLPSIPPAISTGDPKFAHKEGTNLICITRHTPLAMYLRRCRKVLIEDGYSTLHLHGMGAAIPHLLMLSVSLPSILPFSKDDIDIEVRTGTIEVVDEVIPDNEDEDIEMRTRGKGGMSVLLKIRSGGSPHPAAAASRPQKSRRLGTVKDEEKQKRIIIVQEREQEQDDEMAQDEDSSNV